MKEREWHELCRAKQDRGGEVTGITLTPRSAQELASEVLASPGAVTFVGGPADSEPQPVTAGARVHKLVNWAAETIVEIDVDPDAEHDTLTVRYERKVPVGAAR